MEVKNVNPLVEAPKNKFSIRAIIVLTAAFAVWVWIFGDLPPIYLAVFTGIAVAAGIVAHFLYSFWLPWRVTVMAAVLLIYNSILVALIVLQSNSSNPISDCFELLVDVVISPVEMLIRAKTLRQNLFCLAILFGTLFFTPAHSLRPSFPSALVTALGIGIWYAAGLLMLMYAG